MCFLQGVLTKIGGVRKFRKVSDIDGTISGVDKAFGDAIDGAKRQTKKSSGAGCKYIFCSNFQIFYPI